MKSCRTVLDLGNASGRIKLIFAYPFATEKRKDFFMKQNTLFSVRDICEIALFSAVAIVLGFFVEIKIGQNGGSIGFNMIPLIFICFRHGFIKGFIASGIIHGFACSLYSGHGIVYYPLDYLLAYGVLAFICFFYKKVFESDGISSYIYLNIGILLVCTARYLFHVISGVVMWNATWGFSFEYSSLYMVPSTILCMIVFTLLLKPIKTINKMYPVVKRF